MTATALRICGLARIHISLELEMVFYGIWQSFCERFHSLAHAEHMYLEPRGGFLWQGVNKIVERSLTEILRVDAEFQISHSLDILKNNFERLIVRYVISTK